MTRKDRALLPISSANLVRARHLISSAALGMFLALGAGSSGYAQECECAVPMSTLDRGQAGIVTATSGQVSALGSQGWMPVSVGMAIPIGGTLETGPSSRASIAVGSCTLNLNEQTQALVSVVNESVCVALTDTGTAGGVAGGSDILPLGIFGTTAGMIGLGVVVSSGDDSPVSP